MLRVLDVGPFLFFSFFLGGGGGGELQECARIYLQ